MTPPTRFKRYTYKLLPHLDKTKKPAKWYIGGGTTKSGRVYLGWNFAPLVRTCVPVFVVIFAVSQIVILTLTIIFLNTDNSGYSSDGLDFQLYKNTRFRECAAVTPDPARVDCSILWDPSLVNVTEPQVINTLTTSKKSANGSTVLFEWCDIVGCLNTFKVLPSTPRQRAFYDSDLKWWSCFNVATLTLLLSITKDAWIEEHELRPEACPEPMGFFDWFLKAHSAVSFVWFWWTCFQTFRDPVSHLPPSPWSWLTAWSLVYSLHIHPFACLFPPKFKLQKRILEYGLYVAVFVQCWGGLIANLFRGGNLTVYDCVQEAFAAAPGLLYPECTPVQLCSPTKKNLFSINLIKPFATSPVALNGARWTYAMTYQTPVIILFFVCISPCNAPTRRQGKRMDCQNTRRWFLYGARFMYLWASLITVVLDVFGFMAVQSKMSKMNREALITYDLQCRAVHVTASPWRQYMDVKQYGRAVEITRSWFNV